MSQEKYFPVEFMAYQSRRAREVCPQLMEMNPDREIVVMRHVERLGNSEVAEALGLSSAAAGMRYLRAVRRLKAVLTEPPSQV